MRISEAEYKPRKIEPLGFGELAQFQHTTVTSIDVPVLTLSYIYIAGRPKVDLDYYNHVLIYTVWRRGGSEEKLSKFQD